jgi:Mg2+-importing ATPase
MDLKPEARADSPGEQPFWTQSADALFLTLKCSRDGLAQADADERLRQVGPNADAAGKRPGLIRAIVGRLVEPLSLILLAAGVVSAVTGDTIGGSIIVAILSMSIGLDTIQEGRAVRAADVLKMSVALKACVRRGGAFADVGVEAVVPGDVVRVRAGDIVPADALMLDG